MTVETLQLLSLIAFITAVVLFLVAVALFFLLDIPKLVGYLSGRTAKKAIEAMKKKNEQSGTPSFRPSVERTSLTDKISQSGRVIETASEVETAVETEKFATVDLAPQQNSTTVLNSSFDETTRLQGFDETTVLDGSRKEKRRKQDISGFVIEVDLSFTGSSEIID